VEEERRISERWMSGNWNTLREAGKLGIT